MTKEDSDDIHELHPARGTSWTHMPRPLSRRLCPAGQNVRGLIPLIAIIHVMLRWASDFELSESINISEQGDDLCVGEELSVCHGVCHLRVTSEQHLRKPCRCDSWSRRPCAC